MRPWNRWFGFFVLAILLLPAVALAQVTGLADTGSHAITTLANDALACAAVLGAVGTISMAFVELLKDGCDIRRLFQQKMKLI